jgi:Rrf2 family protein
MVQFSTRARYGLRLMHEVAQRGAMARPVRLTEVARVTRISQRYLAQLAVSLKTHALLRSVCGRQGGYVLARPAAEISVRDVLTALIGPVRIAICVGEPERCLRSELCECRLIWLLLECRIGEVLDGYTLADLGNRALLDQVRSSLVAKDPTHRSLPLA